MIEEWDLAKCTVYCVCIYRMWDIYEDFIEQQNTVNYAERNKSTTKNKTKNKLEVSLSSFLEKGFVESSGLTTADRGDMDNKETKDHKSNSDGSKNSDNSPLGSSNVQLDGEIAALRRRKRQIQLDMEGNRGGVVA